MTITHPMSGRAERYPKDVADVYGIYDPYAIRPSDGTLIRRALCSFGGYVFTEDELKAELPEALWILAHVNLSRLVLTRMIAEVGDSGKRMNWELWLGEENYAYAVRAAAIVWQTLCVKEAAQGFREILSQARIRAGKGDTRVHRCLYANVAAILRCWTRLGVVTVVRVRSQKLYRIARKSPDRPKFAEW